MSEETVIAEKEPEVQQEQVEIQQEVKAPVEVPKKAPDRNWDEAREVLRLQKQRIEELEARLQVQKAPLQQPVEDEFAGMSDDDLLPVSKARKLKKEIDEVKEEAQKVIQQYIQQQNIVQDEQRARQKYEDFDFVIENFAIPMIKNDPALAHKIQTSKNPAETAYKLAKISDEYEATQMKQQTSPKAEKILKNSTRPVSSNAVGAPLKSQAEDFSKLSPQQVWEMSQKFARGA